jgi:HEAT repeat protein
LSNALTQRRPAQFLIIAAAIAAAPFVRAQATPAADVPTTDVPALRAALYDNNARPDQREQAAQRLLSRPDPAARDILRVALTEFGQPAVQLAAARALAAKPTADATLVTPLLTLLDPNSPEPLLDATAKALSAYKTDPEVLSRLITLAATADERVRVAAIRASGTFPEKRAAAALVPLADPATQPPRVASEAAAALTYLSGRDGATDAAAWQAWWAENRNKSDAQFQADLANARSARYDQARIRMTELEDEVSRTLVELYGRTPREQKTDVLVRYLRSAEPSVRAAGCRIARTSAETGDVTPQPIKEQLRGLVGDASPAVRRSAALALAVINDAEAVVPLLTQLNQETDTGVRAALADALRPTRDPRAVPVLLRLLDDPSKATAQTAAESLGELGERLRQSDPAGADAAAAKIMAVLEARTKPQDGIELRNALVQAVGPLQSRSASFPLVRMLNSQAEDRRVRRSLLVAVGRYRNADFTDAIAAWMGDEDAAIRLAAVRALGESANSFGEFAARLRDRIDPKEKQPEVRDAAWRVLVGLFKKAPATQLGIWEVWLKDDPEKLIVLLTELRDRARANSDLARAADRDQQLGDANMRAGRFGDAITNYQEALKFAQANNKPSNVEIISEGLTEAYLRNNQFGPGITFVQQRIRQDPSAEGTLGPKIRREAERLVDVEKKYEAATQLIDLALKMDPPLSRRFTQDLQTLQAQVKARNNQQNQTPYPPTDAVQSAMLWPRP